MRALYKDVYIFTYFILHGYDTLHELIPKTQKE